MYNVLQNVYIGYKTYENLITEHTKKVATQPDQLSGMYLKVAEIEPTIFGSKTALPLGHTIASNMPLRHKVLEPYFDYLIMQHTFCKVVYIVKLLR